MTEEPDAESRYDTELTFALDFATWAGARVLGVARDGLEVETKVDSSPVTAADRLVNTEFIQRVLVRFPGDAVLGEEASHRSDSNRTWVIDPVDGTQHMILGIPVFMVSIALVVDGRPVVGAARNPSTNQSYWATAGGGAYRDGTPIRVTTRGGIGEPARILGEGADLNSGMLTADTLLRMTLGPDMRLAAYQYPWPTVFAGCKVAEGSWDGALYGRSAAHDVAAVCVLVREAGGTVTDRAGTDQPYDRAVNGCVLSNGLVHDRLVSHWGR
jgi:fructose-1,6-bisphosphatase/inositol monophosphatase family enzyme